MRPGVSKGVRLAKGLVLCFLSCYVMHLFIAGAENVGLPVVPPAHEQTPTFEQRANPSAQALQSIQDLQAEGFTCSESPTLSDHIVADTRRHDGVVLTFDRAYRLSQTGDAWIRSYCQEAAS